MTLSTMSFESLKMTEQLLNNSFENTYHGCQGKAPHVEVSNTIISRECVSQNLKVRRIEYVEDPFHL